MSKNAWLIVGVAVVAWYLYSKQQTTTPANNTGLLGLGIGPF